jgi:hypothetical protein
MAQKTIRQLLDHINAAQLQPPDVFVHINAARQKCEEWKSDTPLDGSVLGKGAKLHIHHFFPKALMARHGYTLDKINTFANLTVLSEEDNLDISMEEPATYLKRLSVEPEKLEVLCIPRDESLWRVDQYDAFLEARRKMLAQRANEYLGV